MIAAARRVPLLALCVAAAAGVAACGKYEHANDYRHVTDDLAFRIAMNPSPPHAREQTYYTVVVRDKESGQPIVQGEGRLFASNQDQANIWDALLPDSAPGSYKAKLRFLTAGTWAVAIQFRRDSTKPLQRIDWIQDVRAERDSVP
jgi:hypothetical protein